MDEGEVKAGGAGPDEAEVRHPVPNGIHLVRTLQTVTMQLSQMADQKASILMGATFVVFTIAVGQARNATMPLALVVLAVFAFISAVLAVTAVLPRVSPHKSEIGSNILFFGNFSKMSEDEFVDLVQSRLLREEDVLATILRDIYQNGAVLARRKYRFLALAYRTFIVGLSVTLVVFVIEFARTMMHR